ncbi:type II secretion system protein N [uncultured Aquabacterium sp.]|uniref:type II secretion system protein N n=1 Tax=uncultured Aquabacterium sp. TaxID=158753 RepID=UPI0025F9151A|nr:type II secretion system protein N [uncultured Aquabacterium sp.]
MAWLSSARRPPSRFKGTSALTTRWMESTLEVARWEKMRKAGRLWGWWGGALGMLLGLSVFAPAPWLAQLVSGATDGRLLLADARGTVWRGEAVAVLTGGAGSRDARALPGRLNWTLRPTWTGLQLRLQQGCCMPTPVLVQIRPGWGRVQARVLMDEGGTAPPRDAGSVGHWPAAWLSGLGTPWNTLALGGVLRLESRGLTLEWVQGRARIDGSAAVSLDNVSSRVTTLTRLGSYRLDVVGDAQGQLQMRLTTLDGALLLSGEGSSGPGGVRFRGEARATPAEQGALDNLLNIIGRREGDRSVISIG